jgi:hypothetical protein
MLVSGYVVEGLEIGYVLEGVWFIDGGDKVIV